MSKGIAIQTILLLLVGILVVGILVYLVYSYTTGSSTLSTTDCISKITSWCTTCMVSGWSTSISIPDDVKTCGDQIKASGAIWSDNDNCGNGCTDGDDADAKKACAIGDCCNTVNVGC